MRVFILCCAMIACSHMTFAQTTLSPTSADKIEKDSDIYDTHGCPDLLTLSGPVIRELYQAKDIHLNDIQLLTLSNVRFVSETQVDLNEEIIIPLGSVFMIEIDACPNSSGLQISSDLDTKKKSSQ